MIGLEKKNLPLNCSHTMYMHNNNVMDTAWLMINANQSLHNTKFNAIWINSSTFSSYITYMQLAPIVILIHIMSMHWSIHQVSLHHYGTLIFKVDYPCMSGTERNYIPLYAQIKLQTSPLNNFKNLNIT